VQHFINHAAIERASAEIFAGARAHTYLFALIALLTAAAVGVAPAAIWLGLVLLMDEGRKALAARLASLPAARAGKAHLALDVARNTALAVAPALAWSAGSPLGPALAAIMLCVLVTNAAFTARRGRLHTLAACAPYAVLGAVILSTPNTPSLAIAGVGFGIAYLLAFAIHHAHAAAHARMQDAEWVRQLNMSFGETNAAAAWEVDFSRSRLVGAQHLGALLGRTVTFHDVVGGGCFAAPEDHALVRAAFAPGRGAVRRIALEHDALGPDGARQRVRHQGFVRTTPDGDPVRLTCVTRRSEAVADNILPAQIEQEVAAALSTQRETLRKLRNELSATLVAEIDTPRADHSAELAQMLRLLAERAEEVERGVDELAHTRHEADSANLAKSQFLANMSHELRTPLNAIIGYAEMLQEDAEDNGDSATVQDLHRILTAAKHLLSLINEILDLSKIESGRMDVAPAEFDPVLMLEDLIETVRPMAEQNGDVLTLAEPRPAGRAKTDALKLRQCVLNLLSNAAKFTRNGVINIEYDRRELNGVEQLVVAVHDTGIGMSKDHMSRLFQPFVQADPSITQQYGGTGLGLTITRRLAQLLGGDVSVKSVLGQGSSFTLHVPADFGDAATALGAAAKVDEIQGAEDAPLVIVIEDEPDARELAARALTRAGFAVQGVGGGEAGLALARAKKPALVLLDIFLPDRSGWRVLQSLKQDPKTQDIPWSCFPSTKIASRRWRLAPPNTSSSRRTATGWRRR
jgi:signal transduction histidine kinase